MRARNLALGDRDQASRNLNQSLSASNLSDSQLLAALDEARRNGDQHSLGLLLDECGQRETE